MANDYVFADEHFQITCQGTKSFKFGMGCTKVDLNDINNENEWVSSTSMDILLRFHWNTIQSNYWRKGINQVIRCSSEKDKWIDNSDQSTIRKIHQVPFSQKFLRRR